MKSTDLARCLAACLLVSFFSFSFFSSAEANDLNWGRSDWQQSAGFSDSGNPLRTAPSDSTHCESDLIVAAWEADDALAAELEEPIEYPVPQIESAKENPLHTIDPFEADDRIAQLVQDPFEEPAEAPIPSLDSDLDEIEEALDRERQRREQEVQQMLEEEAPETIEDLSEELDQSTTKEEESTQVRESSPSEFKFDLKVPETQLESQRSSQFQDNRLRQDRSLEDQRNCEEELASARANRVSSVDLNIRVEGVAGEDYPYECAFGDEMMEPRAWSEITYNWKASALCHKPLYFEQNQLERYGHSWGPYLQPIMSGVHFFTSVPILPYKMGIESPNECIYALGHYRPGNCAPYLIEATPFTWRAAFYQGAFVTGTSFAIP